MKGITVTEAAQRLTEAGARLGQRYTQGASGKGSRWQQAAAASEANYTQGVQAAIATKRFSAGVASAGASAYDQGVQTKGALNWGTGMQVAGDKYVRKTQKFAALWNQPLSTPRGARRDPKNLQRMQENVTRFQNAAK